MKPSPAFLLLLQMHIILKQKNIFKDSSTFLQFQSQCWTVSLCMILFHFMQVSVKKIYVYIYFCVCVCVYAKFLHESSYFCLFEDPKHTNIITNCEGFWIQPLCVLLDHTLFNSSPPLFKGWKRTQKCVKCYTWVQMRISDSLWGISYII